MFHLFLSAFPSVPRTASLRRFCVISEKGRVVPWELGDACAPFSLSLCEGGVDVVGVVTPLRGGAQVVLHGDQVVELSVLLGVHEKEEVEEDGEGQVEVEREEGEVKEKRTWMTMRMG